MPVKVKVKIFEVLQDHKVDESFFLIIDSGNVGVFIEGLEMAKPIFVSPAVEDLTLVHAFLFSFALLITVAFLFVFDGLVESGLVSFNQFWTVDVH